MDNRRDSDRRRALRFEKRRRHRTKAAREGIPFCKILRAGELLPHMERLRAQRSFPRSDGSTEVSEWVFHVEGRRISKKPYRWAWTKARKDARLEGRIFHDFRRTGARRLINSGVSQAFAMKMTGHKTPSMFRRYQIVEKDDFSLALEKVASRDGNEARGAHFVALNGHRDGHR